MGLLLKLANPTSSNTGSARSFHKDTDRGILLLLLLKKIDNARPGEGDTPYQSENPSPTLPTYRGKEEKEKIVEDKKGKSN